MKIRKVAVIVGTRPEAIKLAPVILALRDSGRFRVEVIATSQHRDMVAPALKLFGIRPDTDLRVMRVDQTLWGLSARLCERLGDHFRSRRPDAVLVQGDTSTAFFGGLAAYYHRIPVGHVEAGLRTGNPYSPFPEEMNRALVGRIATWHFAPTPLAARNLKEEGVARGKIHVTGNTIVDALQWMSRRCKGMSVESLTGSPKGQRLILMTCHRRENFGPSMMGIARAVRKIAEKNLHVTILLPVHPNPSVRKALIPILQRVRNVRLCKPLDYQPFVACLMKSHLVLTDSGGVQEEATALGKPTLVLRTETERPEGVGAGTLKIVGVNEGRIVRETQRLLDQPSLYKKMAKNSLVYGDGKAAERIVRILQG